MHSLTQKYPAAQSSTENLFHRFTGAICWFLSLWRPRATCVFTCDGLPKAKAPFIVDMPAKMLKRNSGISKAARNLYSTMRALANGRTGELAIRGTPLDWQYIRRQAEICRNLWLRALKELTGAGLVSCTRERVEIFKDGRKRVVLGRARYFVEKRPKPVKKPRILLKSLSCTVQERDPQISSETPRGDSPETLEAVPGGNTQKVFKSSSLPKPDDDRKTSCVENPTPFSGEERVEDHWERLLGFLEEVHKDVGGGEDAIVILEILIQRFRDRGITPKSKKYLRVAFDEFYANAQMPGSQDRELFMQWRRGRGVA